MMSGNFLGRFVQGAIGVEQRITFETLQYAISPHMLIAGCLTMMRAALYNGIRAHMESVGIRNPVGFEEMLRETFTHVDFGPGPAGDPLSSKGVLTITLVFGELRPGAVEFARFVAEQFQDDV